MQHFVRTLAYAAVAGVLVFVLPAAAAGPVRVPNGGMVLAPLPAPVDVVCGRGSGRSPLLTPVGPPPQNVHIESNGPLLHTLRWDRLPGITGYNIFLNNIATRNTWMLSNATPQLDEKYLDVSPRQSGAKYRVIALYPDGRQGYEHNFSRPHHDHRVDPPEIPPEHDGPDDNHVLRHIP